MQRFQPAVDPKSAGVAAINPVSVFDDANTALESARDPSEIQDAENAIEATAQAALAALAERRRALVQVVHPLSELLDDRTRLLKAIAQAVRIRAHHVQLDADFRNGFQELLACERPGDSGSSLCNWFDQKPHEACAERIVREIDIWLEVARGKIAPLDAKIIAYAKEHDIEHRLPEDLRRGAE